MRESDTGLAGSGCYREHSFGRGELQHGQERDTTVTVAACRRPCLLTLEPSTHSQ
jgi:hypothetical protein